MISLDINGTVMQADADGNTPLLWVLRDHLNMTGTKFGCGMALCGACTVHIDGKPARSCVTPVSAVAGKKIATIEKLGETRAVTEGQARVGRGERSAVWLLPARAGDGSHGAARRNPGADRRGHRRRHERQHLPLRHL